MSEDFMSDTERWPSVPVPLRPGSVSFHHSMTMHKSEANRSGLRRRGYAIHYMRAISVPEGELTTGAKVSICDISHSLRLTILVPSSPVPLLDLVHSLLELKRFLDFAAGATLNPGEDGEGLPLCARPLFPRQSVTAVLT